jgi:hypothetical protein
LGKLAVIGTFYKRYERTDMLLRRVLVESTRPPDEFFMVCEEEADAEIAFEWARRYENLIIKILPTPRTSDNRYAIVPYSNKINWALDNTTCDHIVYLDNNSMPHPEKYRLMSEALDEHPEWGAVYCSQHRTGYRDVKVLYEIPIPDAFCVLNYTQVMHRITGDRWSLDMTHADPQDLVDARFWQSLHATYRTTSPFNSYSNFDTGAFYPVLLGEEMLDEHYMETMKAAGL